MNHPKFSLIPRIARNLFIFGLLTSSVCAQQLQWDPDQTGPTTGASGGSGIWNATNTGGTIWYDGASDVQWPGQAAIFGGVGGTVTLTSASGTVATSVSTGAIPNLTFTVGGYTLNSAAGEVLGFNTNSTAVAGIALTAGATSDVTINSNISLAGNGAYRAINLGTGKLFLNGVIGSVTTNRSITYVGSGTTVVSGNNTYGTAGQTSATLGVTGTSGYVVANHDNAFGIGKVFITNGSTLTSDGVRNFGNAFEFALSTIAGSHQITFSGAATSALGGTNTISFNNSADTIFTGGFSKTALNSTTIFSNNSQTGVIRFNSVVTSIGSSSAFNFGGVGLTSLTAANTWLGTTTVSGGALRLENATAIPGGIGATGGTANLVLNGGVVELTAANGDFNRLIGTGVEAVQIGANGGGFSAFGSDRSVNLGALIWGAGGFNNAAVLMLSSAYSDATIDFQSNINLKNAAPAITRTVQVANGSAAIDAKMSGTLSNSASTASLLKTGEGALLLSATNSYNGTTTVSAGALVAGANSLSGAAGAFGNSSSAIVLGDASTTTNNSSARLLTGGAFTVGRAITIADQATSGGYAIGGTADATSTFSGLITANQSFSVTQAATTGGNALNVTGGITGNGAAAKTVTFSGPGKIVVSTAGISNGAGGGTVAVRVNGGVTQFNVASTYTGGSRVSAGTMLVSDSAGAGTGAVNLDGGALHVDVAGGSGAISNAVTFSSVSSSYVLERAASSSFSAYAASSDLSGGIDTTASFLGGTASTARTLSTSFATTAPATNDGLRQSDVFKLDGTGTDIFVLQLQVGSLEAGNFLGWLDGSNSWVNAVTGNSSTGGSAVSNFNGSFASSGAFATANYLGSWGYDTATGAVWAVLDHNSSFAVIPEPGTAALVFLGTGLMGLTIFRRRGAPPRD